MKPASVLASALDVVRREPQAGQPGSVFRPRRLGVEAEGQQRSRPQMGEGARLQHDRRAAERAARRLDRRVQLELGGAALAGNHRHRLGRCRLLGFGQAGGVVDLLDPGPGRGLDRVLMSAIGAFQRPGAGRVFQLRAAGRAGESHVRHDPGSGRRQRRRLVGEQRGQASDLAGLAPARHALGPDQAVAAQAPVAHHSPQLGGREGPACLPSTATG